MRVVRVLAIAVVTMALTTGAYAQGKPDFSGKWVMDPASAPAPPRSSTRRSPTG